VREWPKILLCLLTKNNAQSLPRFLKAMDEIDYPKEKLRWTWMYGKSVDNTLDLILEYHKSRPYRFEIYEEPCIKRPIRGSLYNAQLYTEFKSFWKEEPFVLFIDSEIVQIPPKAIKELVETDKDIIAPFIFIEGTETFYPSCLFCWKGLRFGYWPEIASFRNSKDPVELDSVGTMVLIKSKAFLEAEWENPLPFYQFCKDAKEKGFQVWGAHYIKVYHSKVTHYPLEWYVLKKLLPQTELSKIGFRLEEGAWREPGTEMLGLSRKKYRIFEKKFREILLE